MAAISIGQIILNTAASFSLTLEGFDSAGDFAVAVVAANPKALWGRSLTPITHGDSWTRPGVKGAVRCEPRRGGVLCADR